MAQSQKFRVTVQERRSGGALLLWTTATDEEGRVGYSVEVQAIDDTGERREWFFTGDPIISLGGQAAAVLSEFLGGYA